MIQKIADAHPGEEINHELLKSNGVISSTKKLVKVLGRGELTAKVDVKLNKYSKSALAAIESAGGTATEI